MQRVRGWLTVWILPFLVIAGSVVPIVLYWDRFPDPLAVHWGVSGVPNGTFPLWLYTLAMGGGMLLTWWGLISGTRRGPNAPLASVAYFILGLLAAVNAQILYFNLDAETWTNAEHFGALAIGGVLLAAVLFGGLGWLLGGGRRGVPEDVELEVPETTAGTWSGTASNLWIALIAVVPVGFAFVVDPVWAVLFIAISALLVIFAFVRVDATETGVTISLGPIGLPRRRIPMQRITGAGAIEVQALAYGGWGWRIRPGRRSFIIRGGPAIRIERDKGVATVVTVDEAPLGAAVIESAARARRYG